MNTVSITEFLSAIEQINEQLTIEGKSTYMIKQEGQFLDICHHEEPYHGTGIFIGSILAIEDNPLNYTIKTNSGVSVSIIKTFVHVNTFIY